MTAAERERGTRTDTINRALQMYDYMTAQVEAGNEVRIYDPTDGSMSKLTFL